MLISAKRSNYYLQTTFIYLSYSIYICFSAVYVPIFLYSRKSLTLNISQLRGISFYFTSSSITFSFVGQLFLRSKPILVHSIAVPLKTICLSIFSCGCIYSSFSFGSFSSISLKLSIAITSSVSILELRIIEREIYCYPYFSSFILSICWFSITIDWLSILGFIVIDLSFYYYRISCTVIVLFCSGSGSLMIASDTFLFCC